MRALFGAARWLSTIAIALGTVVGTHSAFAETITFQNSSQFGMNLPQASLPNGQDEIRTSDGTSCRSAVGGNGAYFDMGVIASPESGDVSASGAAYGRIVVPLGRQSKRLDCTTLYALEIERLKMELHAARMGIGSKANSEEVDMGASWANEGWGNEKDTKPAVVEAAAPETAVQEPGIPAAASTTPTSKKVNPPKVAVTTAMASVEQVPALDEILSVADGEIETLY